MEQLCPGTSFGFTLCSYILMFMYEPITLKLNGIEMESLKKSQLVSNIFKIPLLRNFFITSLVVCVIFPIYSVFVLIPSFSDQLTANTEDEAKRTATYLAPLIINDQTKLKKDSLSNTTINEIKTLKRDFRLEKLKVFSRQGVTVFSTSPNDIGKKNTHEYFHNIVAKGNVFTKVVAKNTKSLEGQVVTADVVETYVPILANGIFTGAFEIYYDITSRKKRLDNLLGRIYLVLFAITSVLLITIIMILFKASKTTIERFQVEKALEKAYGELELRVDERTAELAESNEELRRQITERTKTEREKTQLVEQLQKSQKMEALGTLAGGVAHDLNNVLSGIVSYPELLLLDMPNDSPYRKTILSIQDSGEKAAAIVQDLLTFSRRGVVVSEIVNLNNCINDYLNSPEFKKLKEFHMDVEVKTDLKTELLNILGSPVHLSKTVMNLVSNAAEAISDGGRIFISTINRYIDRPIKGYDDVEEGDYVVLEVQDNGSGISSKDLDKIFEPFFTKKAMGRSGTGLGMAVVWGTVKDHNGYIDVKSTEGRGTTFTLYFPVTRKEIPKDELSLSIEDYMGNSESILVVDDVKGQRIIASGILRKLGYSVKSVSSGEEAVEYIKNNSADLLVLDMIMDPGINGRETYEGIIKFHPKQQAIIASGFSETDEVKKTQALGAGQYIKKPYTLEKIGIAIRDELKK
jgi:signal transduction histidine kinase